MVLIFWCKYIRIFFLEGHYSLDILYEFCDKFFLGNEYMKKLYVEDIVRILYDIVSVPSTQQLVSVEGMEEGHQWKVGINIIYITNSS